VIIPTTQPIAGHMAVKPAAKAKPGRPRRHHADSPIARSESAAT